MAPISVAGSWLWSRAADAEPGVRTVEVERWRLEQRGAEVRGEYERQATFLSTDGRPFSCNQDLEYRLGSRYRVEGTVTGAALRLREVGYQAQPSPCDLGARLLAEYRGTLDGGALALTWPDGRQLLRRDDGAGDPPAAGAARADAGLAGTWRWQNRTVDPADPDQVRIEQERWDLRVADDGDLAGSYERAVTVYQEAGAVYPCNGETSYVLRERYQLRGTAAGARVDVLETGVDVDPSPCDAEPERTLDAAVGERFGDELLLRWRGGHVQVLHRDGPRAGH